MNGIKSVSSSTSSSHPTNETVNETMNGVDGMDVESNASSTGSVNSHCQSQGGDVSSPDVSSSSSLVKGHSLPIKRHIILDRHPEMGFGFVAGSEKPVVVRFVKEGGPSEGKLQSEDQILEINGEDVSKAPRDRVIELVKTCKDSLEMTVCQPHRMASSSNSARKSSLLTAAKKAKLKVNPSRVRFAEGVVVNGSKSSVTTPSPYSSFDSCVPFMPNVLKVFLENGQTKTFKYDSGTLVQDVLNSLVEKLSIKNPLYFSLCVEHVKARRRNKLTLLDPKDSLSKIANLPGAHNLRCLFRVVFVPKDVSELLLNDPVSFEYFYAQSCNDIVQERFSPELKYEIALRLSALHLLQHALSSAAMTSNGTKVNLKQVEKSVTLKPFLPYTLMETMKSKELHKLLNHYLKQNAIQLCPPGQKSLTSLQAKVHYLRIISELPSYGAKIFPMNIRESVIESALLISRKYGLSHVTGMRNSLPVTLARIEDITGIKLTTLDDYAATGMTTIEIHLRNISAGEVPFLRFSLEERDAEELVQTLKGYHRLMMSHDSGHPSSSLPQSQMSEIQVQHPHPPPLLDVVSGSVTGSTSTSSSSLPATSTTASGYKELPVFREMLVEAVNGMNNTRYHHQHPSYRATGAVSSSQEYDDEGRGHSYRPHSPPPPNHNAFGDASMTTHPNIASIHSARLHSRFTGITSHQRQESDDSVHSVGSLPRTAGVMLPRAVVPVRTSSLHPRIRSMSSSSPVTTSPAGSGQGFAQNAHLGITTNNNNSPGVSRSNGSSSSFPLTTEDDNDCYQGMEESEGTIRAPSSGDTESDIDLPSIVSMEILESAIVAETKQVYRRDDVEKRVAEMHKIVADAQNYIQTNRMNKETQINDDSDSIQSNDSGHNQYLHPNQNQQLYSSSQPMDSLLLIRGPSLADNPSLSRLAVPSSTSSATESESESVPSSLTPQESPLYRTPNGSFKNCVKLEKSSLNDPGSSLHLPLDSLPNLTDAENELIETLKKLQAGIEDEVDDMDDLDHLTSGLNGISASSVVATDDDERATAEDTSSCLEIIDLTALPPPGEEEGEDEYENLSFCNRSLTQNFVPSSCAAASSSSHLTNDFLTATNEGSAVTSPRNGTILLPITSSASSSFLPSSVSSHMEVTASSTREQDNEQHQQQEEDEEMEEYRNALLLGRHFEEFLASVSVPPPPSLLNGIQGNHLGSNVDENEDGEEVLMRHDRQTPTGVGVTSSSTTNGNFFLSLEQEIAEEELSSLIVPPPPASDSSSFQGIFPQDDVIANFWRVTHDVKKIYASHQHQSLEGEKDKRKLQLHPSSSPTSSCPVTSSGITSSSLFSHQTLVSSSGRNGVGYPCPGKVTGSCSDSGYESIPLVVNNCVSGTEGKREEGASSSLATVTLASSSSETSLSSSSGPAPVVVPRSSIMMMQAANKTSSPSDINIMKRTMDEKEGRILPTTSSASSVGVTSGSMMMMMEEKESRNALHQLKESSNRLIETRQSCLKTEGKDEYHFQRQNKSYFNGGSCHSSSGQNSVQNHQLHQQETLQGNKNTDVSYDVITKMNPGTSETLTPAVASMTGMTAGQEMTNNKKHPPPPPVRSLKPPVPPPSASIIERRKQLAKRAQTKVKLGMVSSQENSVDEEDDGDDEDSSSQSENLRGKNLLEENSHHPVSSASSTSSCTSSSSDSSGVFNFNITNLMLTRSFGSNQDDSRRRSQELSGLFIQVVAKIDQMITQMEESHECRIIRADDQRPSSSSPMNSSPSSFSSSCHEQQLNQAKDCLVLESRAFVTSSKLFVKSSTEGLDSLEMIDHLVDCLSLLEKMYKVSNIILLNCESQVQATCLVDRLKEVAATFALTIDTVRRLLLIRHQVSSSGQEQQQESQAMFMGQLMSHATSLATSLSALMRTLRAFSSY